MRLQYIAAQLDEQAVQLGELIKIGNKIEAHLAILTSPEAEEKEATCPKCGSTEFKDESTMEERGFLCDDCKHYWKYEPGGD